MTAKELMEKMKKSRSWKEFGIGIKETVETLEEEQKPEVNSNIAESEEIVKLKEKVERLAESNKQLRAENKALKGTQ